MWIFGFDRKLTKYIVPQFRQILITNGWYWHVASNLTIFYCAFSSQFERIQTNRKSGRSSQAQNSKLKTQNLFRLSTMTLNRCAILHRRQAIILSSQLNLVWISFLSSSVEKKILKTNWLNRQFWQKNWVSNMILFGHFEFNASNKICCSLGRRAGGGSVYLSSYRTIR